MSFARSHVVNHSKVRQELLHVIGSPVTAFVSGELAWDAKDPEPSSLQGFDEVSFKTIKTSEKPKIKDYVFIVFILFFMNSIYVFL
jgi:hypothetical protein